MASPAIIVLIVLNHLCVLSYFYRLVPAIIAHPGGMHRYALTSAGPVSGYHLPSGPQGWLRYSTPYIMHAPLTAVSETNARVSNLELR